MSNNSESNLKKILIKTIAMCIIIACAIVLINVGNFAVLIFPIISILAVIFTEFKAIQLIGVILQLIGIILFSYYPDAENIENLKFEITFVGFLITILGGFIMSAINKKAPLLENTEIKDSVEKWIQDVYMCWILIKTPKKEDWNKIAGRDKNVYTIKEYQDILAEDWEIFNKDDLLENVEGLTIESVEFFRKEVTVEDIKKHNIHIESCLAWDMCRAVMIIGIAYIADYITRDEMREYSKKACKLIQKEFNSWDDLIRNYIIGCKEFFEERGYNEDRTDKYEMLKNNKLAYQIDWNLNLE